MGFWSGFAQGWDAGAERKQRREMFQTEIKEKRLGTLSELISKGYGRSAGGIPKAGEGDATPASEEHYIKTLGGYGMTSDQVGKIAAEGGVYGLKAAVEVIEGYDGPLTPELFARIPDSIVVTQRNGGTVNAQSIAEDIYGPDFFASLEPDQQAILELQADQASAASAPYVSTTFKEQKPINSEAINATIKTANDTLNVRLYERKAQADNDSVDQNLSETERSQAAAEAARIQGLIDQVDNGNPMPAIKEVGVDVIGPLLDNNPAFKDNPGVLGPWSIAAEQYLTGGMSEGSGLSFNSPEEAEAAIRAGQVPSGAVFYINGEPYENDL